METFSALLTLCEGKPPVSGGFPSRRLVTWSFDVFFDLRLNKRLSKQSRRHWNETPPSSLWRHCNELPDTVSAMGNDNLTTSISSHGIILVPLHIPASAPEPHERDQSNITLPNTCLQYLRLQRFWYSKYRVLMIPNNYSGGGGWL